MAQIGVVDVNNTDYLAKYGENLYDLVDGGTMGAAQGYQISQGTLEMSNVNIVDEMVSMITIQRAYEAGQKMIQAEDETLDIEGSDAAEYIAGRYGDCLKAMEYLVNLSLRDPALAPRMRLDSSGYRERRTRSLERLAEATARQALEYGRPIRLEPMLSWERWIIHMALKNREDVRTESIGEPPMRKVVVMPRYGDSSTSGEGGYRPRSKSPRPRFPRRKRY